MEIILNEIARIKPDITDVFKPHTCDRSFCNPQTLYDLKGFGNRDTYLCKYRFYHICNPDHCQCNTCPISGICYGTATYSSYAADDNRTWALTPDVDEEPQTQPMPGFSFFHETPVKVQEHYKSKIKDDEACEKIESIIDVLLYSEKRVNINHEYEQSREKIAERERDAYVTNCVKNRQVVDCIKLQQITERNQANRPPLAILERDHAFVMSLTRLVLHVCHLVERYGSQAQSKLCIVSVTLGVLYMMQRGHSINGATLIPRCALLMYNLPNMNHLSKFGIEKNKFTKGQQIIGFSYESALRQGVHMEELCATFK